MKTLAIFAGFLAVVSGSLAFAEANKVDWAPCSAEVAKFSCTGSEEEIYNCLQAHDAELSAACEAVHLAYEKATGKH